MAHDDQNFPDRSGVSAFGSLALEVVSVLNARQSGIHANLALPQAQQLLDQKLLARSLFHPSDALADLRSLGLSDETIIDIYIPETARTIGQRWVNNELGFAEVTIASVRLQSLLTEVEFLDPDCNPVRDNGLDILVVACEREQHTLGCFVTAAQIRRRGSNVETLCGEPDKVIIDRIAGNEYDAVLFSCSRSQDLESIAEIVRYLSQQLPSRPMFVIGGIILGMFGKIKRLTGVDLVTNDVDMVVSHCDQRSTRTLRQAAR